MGSSRYPAPMRIPMKTTLMRTVFVRMTPEILSLYSRSWEQIGAGAAREDFKAPMESSGVRERAENDSGRGLTRRVSPRPEVGSSTDGYWKIFPATLKRL